VIYFLAFRNNNFLTSINIQLTMGGAHKWISRKKWNERKYFLELFFFTGKDTNVRHSWPQLHRGFVTGLLLSWYGLVWYGMVWYGEHHSAQSWATALPPHGHHMLHM
jgi:hypothetical protein